MSALDTGFNNMLQAAIADYEREDNMTKREVSFFKDRRGSFNAQNIIKILRELGMTDEEIKAEMLKIKAQKEAERTVKSIAVAKSEASHD